MPLTSPANVPSLRGGEAPPPFGDARPLRAVEPRPGVEPAAAEARALPGRLTRVLLRSRDRLRVLRLESVEWIEGAGNYVRFHVGSDGFLYRCPLGELAEKLDPQRFVRIHRSAIVQLDAIEELRPTESGSYLVRLRSGAQLSMSRRYRRAVFAAAGRG